MINNDDLKKIGWNDFFAREFEKLGEKELIPARVSAEHRSQYLVMTGNDEIPASASGKLLFNADGREDLPSVGDWVAVKLSGGDTPMGVIQSILPRKSTLSRQEAGARSKIQLLASNLDIVFVLIGLDKNFNLNRMERFLAAVREGGARPVVLLTKSDLTPDCGDMLEETVKRAGDSSVHAISSLTGSGISEIEQFLIPGNTICLIGSSGVGKSTLLNLLMGGDVQKVREVRSEDSRGRHTTTHRQMFVLPSGALLIDTPGLREFQLWQAGDGLAETFGDIEEIAAKCKYSDCHHGDDPGCAIIEALENGTLDTKHYQNYTKLKKELAYQARRVDARLEREHQDMWKKRMKDYKRSVKIKGEK